MNKKAANIIKYSLSGILAVVLVWFAFRGVDWKTFWEDLQQTRWFWMVLFFVAATLALVFRERRWTALMRPLDPELKRLHVWDSINVGNLVNVVLPGANSNTLTVTADSSILSYRYRCVVTDNYGAWFSNAVSVGFIPAPTITAAANRTSAMEGDTVTFTATASGSRCQPR